MHTTMKKIYQIPSTMIVELNGGALCQSLIIGSGGGSNPNTTGNGTDLVKENTSTPDYNVWDDDWSK